MSTHKFHVKNKSKLDSESRRKVLPPEKTLLSFGLHEGDIMADVGCGIGYFAIPAAGLVGNSGKVFAMDISPEMLKEVQIRIEENGISNIETVLTEENDLKIESHKISIAFISFVLHEAEDKEKFLKEIKRIICPKGKIAILEWKKIHSEFGPPLQHRLDEVVSVELLHKVGFTNISSVDVDENFYALTAEVI